MAEQGPPVGEGGAITSSQVQANLTSAKEARKRAELDAQLLSNRIALLKQEEEKAWKKIEETRKRAGEITDLRKKNEEKFVAKENFYKQKWESIRAAQSTNQIKRDQNKATKDAQKQGLAETRQMEARKTKEQSTQHLQAKKDREQHERQANQQRSSYLKAKKEEAKNKLEEDRLAQLEKFREDYEARTAQEELLRARTDALVARMEKEEMELIQRLQNTQTVQRNAYEELEAALQSGSQPHSASTRTFQQGGGSAERPDPAA